MAVVIRTRGVDRAWGESGPDPIWYRPHRPSWMSLLNRAGATLRRAGLRVPKLDAPSFLAEAERRARLSGWGNGRFRTCLEVLIASFEEQDNAHTFGRLFFREYCVRLLVNRLKIQADLKRHPEILEVPIRRPLIITGLPRSGTTFLHRLMSEDPAGRPLLFWEALEPSPPPRAETRRTDPRIARARKSVKTLYALAPQLAATHLYDAEAPEECNNLFGHELAAGFLTFIFDVPRYAVWLVDQDLVENYRSFRRQLQLLSWRCPGDHWVLKAPPHLFALDAILAVFPDVCIVQTHRDPLQVIPSACSMSAIFRGITSDRVDLRRLGAEYTEALAEGVEKAIAVRAKADPARFFDVSYPRLLADPIGTVREICRYFGSACDAEFEDRMRRWLAENPQHKQGVHRYRLEQFGLDADAVNGRFATYRRWMDERFPVAT
ncbi:MAG: sulfotransferase [Planctomycetaceae bacterium]|nr:sulfotransferase [Planctomycetaceae bacterium]